MSEHPFVATQRTNTTVTGDRDPEATELLIRIQRFELAKAVAIPMGVTVPMKAWRDALAPNGFWVKRWKQGADSFRHACLVMPRWMRTDAVAAVLRWRREELPWTADRVKVAGSLYVDAERPDLKVWASFFAKAKEHGLTDALISEDSDLSDPVVVFRGIGGDGYEDGYSWTLDRTKAEWFARRFSGNSPRVLIGTVARADVLAYFTERDEEEIVARPADVTIGATDNA